jgi:hypothetical protein
MAGIQSGTHVVFRLCLDFCVPADNRATGPNWQTGRREPNLAVIVVRNRSRWYAGHADHHDWNGDPLRIP